MPRLVPVASLCDYEHTGQHTKNSWFIKMQRNIVYVSRYMNGMYGVNFKKVREIKPSPALEEGVSVLKV